MADTNGVHGRAGKNPNNPRGRMQGNALLTSVLLEPPNTYPTPCANEDAAGTPDGKMQKMLGNSPDVRGKPPYVGTLNPDWVEWLMGVPEGWTSLYRLSSDHYGWPMEPPIPRVTLTKTDRVDRIRLLGNGVVPQTAARAWQVLDAELTGQPELPPDGGPHEGENWATPQVTDTRSDVRKPSERSEAAKKGGCSNLREQVHWRTPAAQEAGIDPTRLVCADGSPPRPGERLYDRETGRLCQYGLTQQVKMWPTPSASEGSHSPGPGSSQISLTVLAKRGDL